MKKTFRVVDLIDKINRMLAISTCSQETRCGMIAVLESVLHDTGNYRGFNYIKDGVVCTYADQPDDTRRYYYGGSK
jgi:hypothetical protein